MRELEKIRRLRGLTQKDVADKAHVAEATVAGIEAGRHTPRASTARKLAGALGVTVADLYGEAIPKVQAPSMSGRELDKQALGEFILKLIDETASGEAPIEEQTDAALAAYREAERATTRARAGTSDAYVEEEDSPEREREVKEALRVLVDEYQRALEAGRA